MARILKQSTNVIVRIGPFVDVTDGFTPETGITLGAADEAEALRQSAATLDISGATWAAVVGADGWYSLTLDTTATNTVGELIVVVQDDSECRPVSATFMVVEEAIYDALFGASATGALPVSTGGIAAAAFAAGAIDAAAIADNAIDAGAIADNAIDAGAIATGAITSAKFAAGAIDATAIADAAIDAATFAAGAITATVIADAAIDAATFAAGAINAAAIADGAIDRATFAADTGLQTIRSNTAQAGASGTITLDASASATNDFYNLCWIYLTGGTGAGQVRLVTDYVGATKVASITPAWVTTPDNTSTFAVLPFTALGGLSADALTAISDDLDAQVVETEGSYTIGQVLSILLSVAAGVSTSPGTYKTPNGNATRVTGTVAAGGVRSALTLTPSA